MRQAVAQQVDHLIDVDAHEGPVYVAGEDALYFTTLPRPGPRVDIRRLSLDSMTVSTVRRDAGAANGMAHARDGRLVVCKQLGGALALVDRGRVHRHPPRQRRRPPHADPLPRPRVEKLYVGYWFWGRPSPEQLWMDLGEIHARIKPDFDPTLPEPRAEWTARSVAAGV